MELGGELWRRHGASSCFSYFFVLFVVDREIDLVRELFLALGGRAHDNKHAVPL